MWVNGRQVHSNQRARPVYPDQDRFGVDLQKGKNDILVKLGGGKQQWGFCLRVAKGGDGLVVLSPE